MTLLSILNIIAVGVGLKCWILIMQGDNTLEKIKTTERGKI